MKSSIDCPVCSRTGLRFTLKYEGLVKRGILVCEKYRCLQCGKYVWRVKDTLWSVS